MNSQTQKDLEVLKEGIVDAFQANAVEMARLNHEQEKILKKFSHELEALEVRRMMGRGQV